MYMYIGFWEQMKAHLDMLIPDKRLDKIDIVAHIDPDLLQLASSFCISFLTRTLICRGIVCLKFNERNCGDVVNAFMKKNIQKGSIYK